jgi:multisubunit Na+/H+ antiporter MnhC subunit
VNDSDQPEAPLTVLRGATVSVDQRLIARVLIALCAITLAVLTVIFFLVGAEKNSQINSLTTHGVSVTDTVDSCQGLLGGSGSNPAGYRCWGTFVVNGRSYTKDIPGTALYGAGTKVEIISDSQDPGLIATPSQLSSERATATVFILPVALLAALIILLGLISWRASRASGSR